MKTAPRGGGVFVFVEGYDNLGDTVPNLRREKQSFVTSQATRS